MWSANSQTVCFVNSEAWFHVAWEWESGTGLSEYSVSGGTVPSLPFLVDPTQDPIARVKTNKSNSKNNSNEIIY